MVYGWNSLILKTWLFVRSGIGFGFGFNSFIEQCSNGKSANGSRDPCEALSLLKFLKSNIIIYDNIINYITTLRIHGISLVDSHDLLEDRRTELRHKFLKCRKLNI